ncbi:MAG: hypothetical protein AAFX85_20545, partial [Pseudomonadota bacterium]
MEASYERLREQLGKDLNGVLTVTRASRSALRVRLGASAAGSTEYAMVPRTHNVTALVLVPQAQAATLTTPPLSLADATDAKLGYVAGAYTVSEASTIAFEAHGKFLDAKWGSPLEGGAAPVVGSVELPPWQPARMKACRPNKHFCFFADEPVLIVDDTKTAKVVVPAVENALEANMTAILHVADANAQADGRLNSLLVGSTLLDDAPEVGAAEVAYLLDPDTGLVEDLFEETLPIRATGIKVNHSAKHATVTFPSLVKMGLIASTDGKPSNADCAKVKKWLEVHHSTSTWYSKRPDYKFWPVYATDVRCVIVKPPKTDLGYTVASGARVIYRADDSTGEVRVSIGTKSN